MSKLIKIIFVQVFLLTLNVQAQPSKEKNLIQPDWVTNPEVPYPESEYLTAVDKGKDRKTAEANSIEALAGIFGRSINSKTQASSRFSQSEKDGKASSSDEVVINKEVSLYTNTEGLIAVEIAEVWKNKDGEFYALAIMNKAKASALYMQKISENNQTIERLTASVPEEKETLIEYARYVFAHKTALTNAAYMEKLAIINPPAKAALNASVQNPDVLKTACVKIAKTIPIEINIQGIHAARIKTAFAKVLSQAGFNVSEKNSKRYVLNAEASFNQETIAGNPNAVCRYTLNASLLDKILKDEITPFNITGREIHLSKTSAENKAVNSIEKKILMEFKTIFDTYLNETFIK